MKYKLTVSGLCLAVVMCPLLNSSGNEKIQSFPKCRLVPMKGADGDSFQVLFPDQSTRVIRLYGVDCMEAKIWDESDSVRLKEQRRYFGISNCRKSASASIQEAKHFGELAHKETEALLVEPFTVHTSFADGRGSGFQKRIYAFVTTSSGIDLGAHLVGKGLARAYGVCRQNPHGQNRDELRAELETLEMKAAKRGLGIWSMTNWDSLVEERNLQRAEDAELLLAIDSVKHSGIVDPNTAPRDELMTLPGIGETLALRIIENRPYQKVEDLLKIKGLGEVSLKRLQSRLPEKFRLPEVAAAN
jgi:competence protein ComEA